MPKQKPKVTPPARGVSVQQLVAMTPPGPGGLVLKELKIHIHIFRSGTEKEYDEKQHLLHAISELVEVLHAISELVEEADKGEKISGSRLWRPCHQKQRVMAKFDPPCVCLRIGFGIGVCMGGGGG